MLCSSN